MKQAVRDHGDIAHPVLTARALYRFFQVRAQRHKTLPTLPANDADPTVPYVPASPKRTKRTRRIQRQWLPTTQTSWRAKSLGLPARTSDGPRPGIPGVRFRRLNGRQ